MEAIIAGDYHFEPGTSPSPPTPGDSSVIRNVPGLMAAAPTSTGSRFAWEVEPLPTGLGRRGRKHE